MAGWFCGNVVGASTKLLFFPILGVYYLSI